MTDLDYPSMSREMARLARGAKEQAASPDVSARERRLLRRQGRAAEALMTTYALAAGARDDRELGRFLVKAQKHQKRLADLADALASIAGVQIRR